MKEKIVAKYILLKLASRCNINCSYCYWFLDEDVYKKPAIMTERVEEAFISKLEKHIKKNTLTDFFILFHGGEPMLFGKIRFIEFVMKLRQLESCIENFTLKLAITTNGILIDSDWIDIFKLLNISVTLSIDGNKEMHDLNRVDFKNQGTYDKVIQALDLLKKGGIHFGLLAVYNPLMNAKTIFNFFVKELECNNFDILVPDSNHDKQTDTIANFYTELFDIWYEYSNNNKINIRLMESISKGILGIESNSESIGYGQITTFTLLTDGSLEPLDVLRVAGTGFTKTRFNIFENEFEDIQQDELWEEIRRASVTLPEKCQKCKYSFACGGGHIAHRYSKQNGFNNNSVYCDDYINIFNHCEKKISNDIYHNKQNTFS